MKNEPVTLVPRWCEHKDILRGWVILHSCVTHPRNLKHLRYIRLHCRETGRTIYCRIFGPGSKPYNQQDQDIVQRSIFLDAHYQQRLEIPEKGMGKKEMTFEIEGVNAVSYYLNAVCHHPDDGVRVGAFLGLVSLGLALLSIYLSLK